MEVFDIRVVGGKTNNPMVSSSSIIDDALGKASDNPITEKENIGKRRNKFKEIKIKQEVPLFMKKILA